MYTMLLITFLSIGNNNIPDDQNVTSVQVSTVGDCYRVAREAKAQMRQIYGNKYNDIKFEMSCKKNSK